VLLSSGPARMRAFQSAKSQGVLRNAIV